MRREFDWLESLYICSSPFEYVTTYCPTLAIPVSMFPVMAIVIAPALFAVFTASTVSGVAFKEQITARHRSSNSLGTACTNSLLVYVMM